MSQENEPLEPADSENERTTSDASAGPQDDLANEAVDSVMETLAQQPEELSETEKLKSQVDDAEKRVLLAQADLENFRKRTRRDTNDRVKYASLGLMNELLESVDNLQRAVEAYQQEPNGDGLAEGVAMVASQIAKALENHGCKKIEAVGEPFDPNLHQALQMQPSDDHPENTVMMDLRAGFLLHDRLIRPSQVFVSTGKQES